MFLGRPILDTNTQMWEFSDGSGSVPAELKSELEIQLTRPYNTGIHILAALWEWKKRLASKILT